MNRKGGIQKRGHEKCNSAKVLRGLSALRKTRGFLMLSKKKGLRELSALRKSRGFLMFSKENGPAHDECLAMEGGNRH
jgi:hypothetical protein